MVSSGFQGNPLDTVGFPSQRASNVVIISMTSWRFYESVIWAGLDKLDTCHCQWHFLAFIGPHVTNEHEYCCQPPAPLLSGCSIIAHDITSNTIRAAIKYGQTKRSRPGGTVIELKAFSEHWLVWDWGEDFLVSKSAAAWLLSGLMAAPPAHCFRETYFPWTPPLS